MYKLAEASWIPQNDGDSISFVRPCDALREHLPAQGFPWPKGSPHDAGEEWIKAIKFGEIANEKKEEHAQQDQNAKEFGFGSADEASVMSTLF